MIGKRFLSFALIALTSGMMLSCDDETTDGGDGPPPLPNKVPTFLNASTIQMDTLAFVGTEYVRVVMVEDQDADDIITLTASSPFQVVPGTKDGFVTYDTLKFTPDTTDTFAVWVTASDGDTTVTLNWTMRTDYNIDKSKSHPRLEVSLVQGGRIHSKLINTNLVGRLYLTSGTDTTFIQQKMVGPVTIATSPFNLEFDSTVDTGSYVIVDYWFEKDTTGAAMDNLYAPPPDTATIWLSYPEPSGRWYWGPIVYDLTGGHGVQVNMPSISSHLFDLSLDSRTPLAP